MKYPPGGHRHRLRISGDELSELKRHTWAMAEAFGLDRKIENYKGTRPITLDRADLDCLLDVIAVALRDEKEYPDRSAPGYLTLERLGERLRQEYEGEYGPREPPAPPARKEKSSGGKTRKKTARGKPPSTADVVYQFKITLLDTRPPIWRRIQVKDCTLDKLHEHIQTAMGWTNSYLHDFKIQGKDYGDPLLLAENFMEFGYRDSTTTSVSDILPKGGKPLRFTYQYDFGDSWQHEVLFEGIVEEAAGKKYPLCLEGARTCPPEDIGGAWGYADFLESIQNEDHKQHDEMLEWVGGSFDPEAFSPAEATRRMKRGLPDTRRML
jgi:hypothetical protein